MEYDVKNNIQQKSEREKMKGLKMDGCITVKDISSESWREYEWIDPDTGRSRTYCIDNPKELHYQKGASCHVVVDYAGVAHCVPSVGRFGCILRWKGKEGHDVSFVSASAEDGNVLPPTTVDDPPKQDRVNNS